MKPHHHRSRDCRHRLVCMRRGVEMVAFVCSTMSCWYVIWYVAAKVFKCWAVAPPPPKHVAWWRPFPPGARSLLWRVVLFCESSAMFTRVPGWITDLCSRRKRSWGKRWRFDCRWIFEGVFEGIFKRIFERVFERIFERQSKRDRASGTCRSCRAGQEGQAYRRWGPLMPKTLYIKWVPAIVEMKAGGVSR